MRPRFLIIAFITLIFAGLSVSEPVRAASNLLFILDSSGSMWGKLEGKSKMETAKAALSKLVGDLPEDTGIGLMAYGHRYDRNDPDACADIELLVPVGKASPEKVVNWLKRINPKGKTPIAGSLKQTPGAFAGLEGSNNNIVLISDGIETCDGDPCVAAGELAASNINVRVHVVGFDISVKDRAQLECIAELGKGNYFPANSTDGFTTAVTEAVQVAQAETKPEPVATEPKEVFRDDFEGEELADHWEVLNPNPDSFIVEDGALLVVSGTVGSMATETVENLYRLSTPLPKGDWTITAKFSLEFQTGKERAFIGIVENGDNYLEIAAQAFNYVHYNGSHSAALNVDGVKRSKGVDKATSRHIWTGDQLGVFADAAKNMPQPILLRLEKKGRSYIGSAMLEGAEEPKWEILDSFTILRLKGSVSLGFYQRAESKSESAATIDWIKIETSE